MNVVAPLGHLRGHPVGDLKGRVRCWRATTGFTTRPEVSEAAMAWRSSKAKANMAPTLMARRIASHTGDVGRTPIAKVTAIAPPMRERRRTEAPGTCRPELKGGRVSRAQSA
jgi:hypothetical protein